MIKKMTLVMISWTLGLSWQAVAAEQADKICEAVTLAPFDEETVTDIEAGIKTELFDNRIRPNNNGNQCW